MKEEAEEINKVPGNFPDKDAATEPPAEPKPIDINKQNEDEGKAKDKKVSEIINSGFNADEEEYTEAKSTVSQQPEPQGLSQDTLNALDKGQLEVLLQNYQAMLEKGEIDQADFDKLRKEVEGRI